MSTHSGRAYLNSCLKVPIDPCNNCPAPVYNRPKLCLGKKQTGKTGRAKGTDSMEAETPGWTTQTGIRSLAKFYDSIPDYCDVKHMHQEEFYSTLESLRSTSRELRAQPRAEPPAERCASASSSSLGKSKKRAGKGKKKRLPLVLDPAPASVPPTPTPLRATAHSHANRCSTPAVVITPISSCLSEEYDKCLRDLSRLKSFKEDYAVEVADFKRSLKSFEEEFKRPKTTSSSGTQTAQKPHPTGPPGSHTAERAKCRREMLRRCFSVNDLGGIAPHSSFTPPRTGQPKLSKYFLPKKEGEEEVVPKIQIESPSVSSKRSSSASTTGRGRGRRGRGRKPKITAMQSEPEEKCRPPLRIFELEEDMPKRTPSVSPLHPVARPNLAATLRAEVSRKKVKELKNNCTYHDPRPQFDWEVRKTPAWKSMSLNESHKALLSIRLATRKAEQALQERQYDLHMTMMRQRVKSAPLLLEGPTFWGPEVGKLSHTCQSEGRRHACESSKQRRKKSSCPAGDADGKIQQLRKIYGSEKSCSRQSQRSKRSARRPRDQETPSHDSGDDLCSVDRAFL
ncbi:GL21635 [Drosophila persimilis]|uniref:GL21635 n=2 Tax=pseudoobscura subgroup TaxID=32358 RepID=B4GFE7_DROPE|nr:uncharacterized protein LOC6591811 [Drosophila persimilis]XP_026850754.1 uncharacterized protein LOC6591811 [Drosophila persimilis]EDW34332.1 GL21635 [Drosophila persimilis]